MSVQPDGDAETARLASLASHDPDSLTGDPELQQIADFAAALCDAPIALVSLVEDVRQRFLVRFGLAAGETPRSQSFCAHAMLGDAVMTVPDAKEDPRFADNALVTGPPHIRFYAGAPLVADDGASLGSLCVISPDPRPDGLSQLQRDGLEVLAQAVMRRLSCRREELSNTDVADRLAESEERFRVLADSMPQMVWSTRPDGYHDYYNARWYQYTGMPQGSTDGEEWNGMFHPDDQDRAWARWRHSLMTGEPYEIEYRLRNAAGEYRWTLGRALPMRDQDGSIMRWFGTCTDIHDQKSQQEARDLLSRELVHRIKNIFSVVAGLAMLTGRERPEAKAALLEFSSRLTALAAAYDHVTPTNAGVGNLHELLDRLFAAYRRDGEASIRVEGDNLELTGPASTATSLLFHELATNAVKYGALSKPDGSVDVTIERNGDGATICWTEHGGPSVDVAPTEMGFGSELIESTVVRQLRGTIDRKWDRQGLVVEIGLPARALA